MSTGSAVRCVSVARQVIDCAMWPGKNRDIKKEINKDKDSTVYITEYGSKRNPTVKAQ